MDENSIFRIIDANLNRAREGIRVVEDTVRFLYNDKKMYMRLRRLRHSLENVVEKIYPKLIKYRDTKKDVGRKSPEEKTKNIKSLMISNFKRAQEALRVLQEYSRLISSDAGVIFKNIRFKLYALEKEIMGKYMPG